MQNILLKQIQEHFECLGYLIEDKEHETSPLFIAFHDIRANLIVQIIGKIVFMAIISEHDKEWKDDAILKELNVINSTVLTTRWVLEYKNCSHENIKIEFYCYGYERSSFGLLLEQSEKEYRQHMLKLSKPPQA